MKPINLLLFIFLFPALLSCGKNSDFNRNTEIKKLLESNEIQRKAHLTGDAGLLVSQIADTMVSLNRGEIRTSSVNEIEQRFQSYFSNVRYTSWDDVSEPDIFLSDDYRIASVNLRKLLDIQYKDDHGNFGDHHYSLFAWNALYERNNGEWKIFQNTSTDKILTKEEAAKLPITFSEIYGIIDEADLIPEGIAYNNATGITYISSTYKQKIVALSPDGTYSDFKKENEDGLWSTLGMEVDESNNILWVVSFNGTEVLPMKNPERQSEWSSRLFSYNLENGNLIKILEPALNTKFAFNDLCINQKGDVFITESLNNKVYKLNSATDSFEEINLQDSLFIFPNGITISDDDRFLYIATINGIFQFNIQHNNYRIVEKPDGIIDDRIDGLAYKKGFLIANQPYLNRILQFKLNEEKAFITEQRILEANNQYFDQPTTGEVAGDYFIYLANAQMRSGFNDGILKDIEELESVKILKLKLPSN